MEQHLVDLVRKPWVVLLKMIDEKTCDVVAKHWLNKKSARCKEFRQATGIDLQHFLNYYVEAGGEDAPVSPILPAKISPILVLRRGLSGKGYDPIVLEITGFFHLSHDIAWVRTTKWEELLGDQDFLEKNFPKIEKQSDRGRQQVIKYAAEILARHGDKR